jgi:glycosyltransferase involved in cell wall biosynthesis
MVISTPFPPEEGIGYYAYNLSKNLIKRGHSVTIATRGNFTYEKNEFEGITIIKAPFFPIYPFHVNIHNFFMNRIFGDLHNQYDIVHMHTPLTLPVKTTLPIVSTIHNSVIANVQFVKIINLHAVGHILLSRISYSLISDLIDKSKIITTVSNSVAEDIKKYYGVKNPLVLGNGVDLELFKPDERIHKENCILFVGRISYVKGVNDLVECARILSKKYDITFTLAGRGELEQKIKKLIEGENLDKTIRLVGQVGRERLLSMYQKARIFLIPSYYEGLPTVLLEAMACGLPVVATNVSGCKDVISHGYNGLLIPPKSPERMAQEIINIVEHPELENSLGKNARKTVEEKYSWDVITDKFLECYNLALST